MLFSIFVLFIVAIHEVSSLTCYDCPETSVDFWINATILPSFPTDCSVIEAQKQCTTTIVWTALSNVKKSAVNYFDDYDLDFLPKGSSLFFVGVDLERELRTKSSRALLYSCTTDNCNDQTSLQRVLNALTLEENFEPFDVLFNNNTTPFTEQDSCINFANSTHLDCPTSASPISLCTGCLLLEMESTGEVCARCPEKLPTLDLDYLNRRVLFFLENRTRLDDKSTLVCRTKGCNTLDNVKKIHQLSKLEFDFNIFVASSSSITMISGLSVLLNVLLVFTYLF